MSDAIEQARAAIEQRLAELEGEGGRLRRALADLGAASNGGTRAQTRSRRAAPRRKRRARRGQRREQFLKAVESRVGEPVSVLAKEIGVPPQQLYPIARKLREEKLIVKEGAGFALERDTAPAG